MKELIAISVLLLNTIVSASPTWTYIGNLGHVGYCCICQKDFVAEDVIQKCYSKNKNDPRHPFCNCHKGIYPECTKSTTICNKQVWCPERLAYKECKMPFLNNAKLVCNDSLEWEPDFTCPECPENTTICNRQILCPERLYYNECQVPFLNNTKLVCNGSLKWESNFTCPECPENTTICNRQIKCPERLYLNECKVPFVDNGKLVCNDNQKWESNFTCPALNTLLTIILSVIGGLIILTVIIIAACCLRKRSQSSHGNGGFHTNPEIGRQGGQQEVITLLKMTDQVNLGNGKIPRNRGNGGQGGQQGDGNPEGNAPVNGEIPRNRRIGGQGGQQGDGNPEGNAPGNGEIPRNRGNGGQGGQQGDGNPEGNAPGNGIIPPNRGTGGQRGPQRNGNPEDSPTGSNRRNGSGSLDNSSDDEGQPLISMTSGIEETGSRSDINSRNEDETLLRRQFHGNEQTYPLHDPSLYCVGLSAISVPSFSPESIRDLDWLEATNRQNNAQ